MQQYRQKINAYTDVIVLDYMKNLDITAMNKQ